MRAHNCNPLASQAIAGAPSSPEARVTRLRAALRRSLIGAHLRAALGTFVVLAVVGCASTPAPSPSPSPAASAEPTELPAATWPASSLEAAAAAGHMIEFDASDGIKLAGREFGSGQTVVVFSHMGDTSNNESDWYRFAAALADHGFRAITYNRRGVCPGGDSGCSDGKVDPDLSSLDLLGAISYARKSGATKLIIAGASFGADTSIQVVTEPTTHVDGMVWVAGNTTSSWGGHHLTTAELAAIKTPLLIVVADHDPFGLFVDAHVFFDHATAPKRLVILHSTAHGTDMLIPGSDPALPGQFLQAVLTFLETLP